MKKDTYIATIEEWNERDHSFKASGKWYLCSLALYTSLRGGHTTIGDTVSVELHRNGTVKSVVLKHRPASADKK